MFIGAMYSIVILSGFYELALKADSFRFDFYLAYYKLTFLMKRRKCVRLFERIFLMRAHQSYRNDDGAVAVEHP